MSIVIVMQIIPMSHNILLSLKTNTVTAALGIHLFLWFSSTMGLTFLVRVSNAFEYKIPKK